VEEFTNGISHNMEDRMNDKATKETTNPDPKPTALPPEVLDASDPPTVPAERPLHLRVLGAMIDGQVDEARVDRALTFAQEIYELETANASLDNYRSAS
jgi:hypothetical protein